MSQQTSQYGENVGSGSGTSQSGKPGTSHPLYRGTLYNNYITLDYSGRQMPEELRTFASTQILKQRESPQLGDEAVSKVIDTVEELADSTEGPTAKLMRTGMFPFERPGIAEGGNSSWNTLALPNNPDYQYDVSALSLTPTSDTPPTKSRAGRMLNPMSSITQRRVQVPNRLEATAFLSSWSRIRLQAAGPIL